MSDVELFDDVYQECGSCRCARRPEPPVFARPHTPERLEACLVEARFTVTDHDDAAGELDRIYERRGGAWIDEIMINGLAWPRAALWLTRPDRLNVETSTRETYERIARVVKALPTTRKLRTRREHEHGRREHHYYGYRELRLHRDDPDRPTPGPAEAVDALLVAYEMRWLQRPHDLLDGMTPEEAAKNDETIWRLYDLLELAEVRGRAAAGLSPGTDLNRVRDVLGIGRRW